MFILIYRDETCLVMLVLARRSVLYSPREVNGRLLCRLNGGHPPPQIRWRLTGDQI